MASMTIYPNNQMKRLVVLAKIERYSQLKTHTGVWKAFFNYSLNPLSWVWAWLTKALSARKGDFDMPD